MSKLKLDDLIEFMCDMSTGLSLSFSSEYIYYHNHRNLISDKIKNIESCKNKISGYECLFRIEFRNPIDFDKFRIIRYINSIEDEKRMYIYKNNPLKPIMVIEKKPKEIWFYQKEKESALCIINKYLEKKTSIEKTD